MGLFGGSKTYVASTVYNLAGPPEDRPDYLKSVVAGNVITNSRFSMSDSLTSSYLHGPGIGARSFYRWALIHYAEIGVPPMEVTIVTPTDNSFIVPHLPVGSGETATILEVQRDPGDITYWAERWIIENHPDLITEDWEIDWDGTTVTVIFVDTATTYTFTPSAPAFDVNAEYVYVSYNKTNTSTAVVTKAVWIYKVGSGITEIDESVEDTPKAGHFWPFIPIRHNGKFLSPTYHDDIYKLSKKAYKKATGQKLDDLIDKIKENDDVDDIDYAYIVYGVPLNTKDNSARKYLFRLFKGLVPDTPGEVLTNRLKVRSPGTTVAKMNMSVKFDNLTYTSGAGLGKAGAKKGEVWLTNSGDNVSFYQQTEINSWEKVTATNLRHENVVYDDKSVWIYAHEALNDADESGFLVPLHYETVREMSLIDSTQMMTSATFIVFNSYEVVKKKWYETWAFKIFVFIAIVALVILIPPLGAGALATWTAIGTAIGLTGVLAIVAGAVITQLVTMLVMRILQKVGVALFGEKFGAIFAAVATFAVMATGQGLLAGQSMATIWGGMMSAPNLMALTNATAQGVSGYVMASAQAMQAKTEQVLEDYNEQSKYISELFAENIGYGRGWLNPMGLTDTRFGNFMETEEQFLQRTLMTGSDIAELSMDMLTNFSAYTLSTDLR